MKHLAILLLLVVVVLPAATSAQLSAVYVPESAFTNKCNVIPMGGAWPSSNPGGEWTYQTHLKASAIGRSGTVVGIAFLSCYTTTLTAPTGQIRMSHTSLSTPSSTFATNMPSPVTVFPAGSFVWTGQSQKWSPLPMTESFNYNGTSNLTIELRLKGAVTAPQLGGCDTNSSHANTPLRSYTYGAGAYAATTATATGSTAGLKVRLLFASSNEAYVPSYFANTGSCNSYPMGTDTEWRFQMIVNAQYLPSSPVKITDLAFAPCNSAKFTAKQFLVRMSHTTLKNFKGTNDKCFDPNLCPCPTTVYNGSMAWNAVKDTWSPLGLNCKFGYDGKRNLLIELRYMGGNGGTSVHRDSVVPRLWAKGAGAYNAGCGSTDTGTTEAGPKIRLTLDSHCILLAGETMKIGGSGIIMLYGMPANQFYQIGASFGQTPLNLGPCTLCLAPDTLFYLSLFTGPPLFVQYVGAIPSAGVARGMLNVPAIPQLKGLCVYHAAVAYGKPGILCCTNTAGSELR